jgi:hypothetical protein
MPSDNMIILHSDSSEGDTSKHFESPVKAVTISNVAISNVHLIKLSFLQDDEEK